ncbi:MAG TPA: GNAT family N-acetyltransferase [Firmicutes bacterium]|nr:GNAT family N-acetyltransferase [Bacillota bacterium]
MKKIRDPQKAAALFRGWDQVMLRSCLQGMAGAVYADREESPASAAAVTGDFVSWPACPTGSLWKICPAICSAALEFWFRETADGRRS